MATTTRKTRTPGATGPAPEVKTTAQQADEALDAILGTQSTDPQPEAIAIEQFDAVAEENHDKISEYSGSSVIRMWKDGRVKVLRE